MKQLIKTTNSKLHIELMKLCNKTSKNKVYQIKKSFYSKNKKLLCVVFLTKKGEEAIYNNNYPFIHFAKKAAYFTVEFQYKNK